ncbi:hypothetical protein BC938DRAFT_478809 [Jimgerdemannia flammicorona]|uniref:P-loop containing nucleoside triphosphate hydrolase protein n=2 Tax=Jimgerdemannia flammicorona TaxID=994334 RepID=A0A433QY48_9FUNG|nr:hypothetical protein BC938DRAFT_478809 [Jimgerdemannia flammicorona]
MCLQYSYVSAYFAWNQIIMLYVVKFIQGSGGIDALRTYLWVPIHQYTTRKLSVKILSHLHSLSLEYHLNRQTGEVLRIVDRGTTSVQDIFQSVLFRFLPAVADALIGVSYFTFAYGWSFGLIIFVVVIFYVAFTIGLTEQRTRYSRESNELDQEAEAMIVDSLLNYETVKYYTAEEFEIRRYANAVAKYQKLEFQSANTNNLLWIGQDTVINAGLCVGSLLLVWRVVHRELTVGDYVFFGQYIMQMFGQFGILGWIYIDMQHSLVDMEKMLELLKVEPTVKDSPDSKALVITEGNIVFDNVSFFYDHRNYALRKISFTIPKGATVALVGPSGGGKTTILRLLFRFYDVTSGRILVDGQDIRTVTQRSLRQSIGVVPQETSLFNESIMFNIRYGSFDATDEEVYAAAKAALIHDRIVAFPDGYESIIGERGLKLSGGEKQRVAIARMFLKNPPILFLDEATSALDSTTERLLQNSLATMTKDRTTIVIAHRLSTIVDADLILCISDGQVVESGTHDELMQSGQNGTSEGIYYKMYQKQTKDRVKTTLQTDAVDEVSDNSPSDRNTV